jgi:UDP-N-acetylglucosamine--N-acetylmuramyl-(pentapeptide) pyrophosphoryl-undecaprenol N-acetylglucosamine transferase
MSMRNFTDHIVFAGGGTAGHLFPGLAVADQLRRNAPQLRITFAGTGKPFEVARVRQAGFEYLKLACRPFPRSAADAFRFLTGNIAGYYAARRFLRDENVALVVGLGGYASVPAARAAVRLEIPCVLLEQNAVPGRATRWLAPAASLICSSFDGIRPYLRAKCPVRVTGNPLRREFIEATVPDRFLPDRTVGRRKVVVLGGSGGAQTLNECVPLALYKARAVMAAWQVVHQTGPRDVERTGQLYSKLGIKASVLPFIDNMPLALGTSQLAISRAGGTTLAELAASGVPAILLPYPRATHDHQRKNADWYVEHNAARSLHERELTGRLDTHLAGALCDLAAAHRVRVRMAHAMTMLARPDATARVARSIGVVLESGQLVGI